jgi:hypothetical protein
MKRKASAVAFVAVLAVLGAGSALAVSAGVATGQDDKVGRLPAVISPEAVVTPGPRSDAAPPGDDDRATDTPSSEDEHHDGTTRQSRTRNTSATTEREHGTDPRGHGNSPEHQHDD